MKETVDCDRLNGRRAVLLRARCRTSTWRAFDVELDDISEGGCCIVGSTKRFLPMQPVSLRFANLANLDARIRWIAKGRVGVEFRFPLKRRVIEELGQTYGIPVSASRTVPGLRSKRTEMRRTEAEFS